MSERLAVVLPDLHGGGAQRVIANLIGELDRRGLRTQLLVVNSEGPLRGDPSLGQGVHELGKKRVRHSILPIVRYLRSTRPTVILSTIGYLNLILLAVRPLLSPGTQIWVREANFLSANLKLGRFPRFWRFLYQRLYPTADKVICSSQKMRDELRELAMVPNEALVLLANPVDEEKIRRIAEASLVPRMGSGRKFVAVGRLTEQKGFDRLLDMFAKSKDEEAYLAILGDGPQRAKLEARAAELGIGARVGFLGYVVAPWGHIAASDALLVASRWEGMPNVALEALACGVPAIATPESGGIAELASECAPGAVTVVREGSDYIAAIDTVRPNRGHGLRRSLLPRRYSLAFVADVVEEWLRRCEART